MKIAIQFGATDLTADPGRIAYEAEIRGFDGIFFPEHTHMPVDSSDFPYKGAVHRLDHTARFMNPIVAMAWAASTTKTLKIGTCVALPAQHDPIILAKALGSLDMMSNGRIVYGFGFGWNAPEMADHGVDPKWRRSTTREKMLAVKAIWEQEEASFSGRFVNFPACQCWPKPQPGRIPILLGARADQKVFEQVVEYCDGWMPPQRGEAADFAANIQKLKALAAERGRDPKSIRIQVIAPERSIARFEALAEAGVERAILHTPYAGVDEVLKVLDSYVEEFVGRFDKDDPG